MICMSALYLRLPNVVVRVDEAWRDELSRTVNHFSCVRRRVDFGSDARDLVALDQERLVLKWNYMIISRATGDQQSGVL
jgi:hypothetical protein